MGNNHTCRVIGIESVSLKLKDGSIKLLRNVRHVSNLKRNLISLGMLDSIGCTYGGSGGTIEVKKDSKIVLTGVKINGLYVIQDVQMVQSALVVTGKGMTDSDFWHKRLSHISAKCLQILAKHGILPQGTGDDLSFCEQCVMGKARRQSFSKSQKTTKGILDYVHSDLWGPAPSNASSNSRYFLTFTDDYSRKSWISF